MSSDDELRKQVHMAMLEKSDSAKDLGEITVVPLGFAVSIAIALIASQRQQWLQKAVGVLPEKKIGSLDAMWDFDEGVAGMNQRTKLIENDGYNQAIDQATAALQELADKEVSK